MGEAKRNAEMAIQQTARAIGVGTPGKGIQVRWDSKSAATPFGQMASYPSFSACTAP